MTDCITEPLLFSSLKRQKIQADFRGGRLTSDGGAVLLRQVDRWLGLIDAINACIPDPRHRVSTVHSQRTLLAQRIFGIALGYEDLNDHQSLRQDPLFQILSERGVRADLPLASPPTLCRLENRVDRKALGKIAELFVETFIGSATAAPEELILDFDPTNDPVHGNQEQRFFHGYYDQYCFLPLYVFCGSQLLVAYLRPANIDGTLHSRAILKLLVKRFRRQWPNVRIVFRGDSGFCRWKLMRWCDQHDVGYIIGLARNAVLERLARPWTQTSATQFAQTQQKQRLFGQFVYGAETWDRPRRVIVKAEHLEQGPNSRFVVTNLAGEPQALYDDLYCQRGDAENRIKEQQLGLFADRTSCHDFVANQCRVLLSAAAYILLDTLRREALARTELAQAQVDTIRLKLLKIGARVVCSVRRVVIHLAQGYPLKDLFTQILSRLHTLPIRLAASG
ncbi:MAG: IS1380 family transposase [Planctomycetaceae bacterium]|nr:MAG: IS1380 family transposase [Planctomycetaceae bacterium]